MVVKRAQGFNVNQIDFQCKQFSLSDPSLKSCDEVLGKLYIMCLTYNQNLYKLAAINILILIVPSFPNLM